MTNPLLSPSELPFGLPPFADISPEHYAEAIDAGLAAQLQEITAITGNSEPPTFENTAAAMERSGQLLARAAAAFFTLVSADASEKIREIETDVSPKLAEHQDAIYLNSGLYERFLAIDTSSLDAASARLVEEYLKEFRQSGIQLDQSSQDRLRAINAELSRLGTDYGQRVKEGMKAAAVLVEDPAGLAGLSTEDIATAAEAAREAGADGKYLLGLIQPSNQPVLASLEDREVRRRLYEASVSRGIEAGPLDVRDLIARTVRLRAEKASLLGFPNFAELMVDRQTAPDLAAVQGMLTKLAPAAMRNAHAEARALAEEAGHSLEPWDWAYYSARVRKEKFQVDEQALRPYFALESVLVNGVFHAATQLYGVTFHERSDLQGYHPDVRVWEVRDGDGSSLGLFLGDYFSRETKRGGAWMNSLVDQSHLLGTRAVVINNLNVSKPAPGEPALLTLDEVRTVFHEFGHALHGLFSDVASHGSPGHQYRGTSSSTLPRSMRCGSRGRKCWQTMPGIMSRTSHCPGKQWRNSRHRSSGVRVLRPRNTSAPRCWTWRGTLWGQKKSPKTSWISKAGPSWTPGSPIR